MGSGKLGGGKLGSGKPGSGKLSGGSLERVLLLAKGSDFLGRMTQMADGMSFILERNGWKPTALSGRLHKDCMFSA